MLSDGVARVGEYVGAREQLGIERVAQRKRRRKRRRLRLRFKLRVLVLYFYLLI